MKRIRRYVSGFGLHPLRRVDGYANFSVQLLLYQWATQDLNSSAQKPEKTGSYDKSNSDVVRHNGAPIDQRPDLACVVDAWAKLPNAVKVGIVAMIEAAKGEGA